MEALLEELEDHELLEKVRARLASNSVPVDVNIANGVLAHKVSLLEQARVPRIRARQRASRRT